MDVIYQISVHRKYFDVDANILNTMNLRVLQYVLEFSAFDANNVCDFGLYIFDPPPVNAMSIVTS